MILTKYLSNIFFHTYEIHILWAPCLNSIKPNKLINWKTFSLSNNYIKKSKGPTMTEYIIHTLQLQIQYVYPLANKSSIRHAESVLSDIKHPV